MDPLSHQLNTKINDTANVLTQNSNNGINYELRKKLT